VKRAAQLRGALDKVLATDRFPVAIGPAEGEALREWVVKADARRTLEIGLGFAVSSLFICEGLLENGGGRHVACDPFQFDGPPKHHAGYEGVGVRTLEEAGVDDFVEFYPEESQIVLPRLLADGRRFDFAFIDGNHRFEAVFVDLADCARLLADGRIVFVDDTQLPGVRKAVDFWLANLDWSVEDEGREGDEHEWLVLRTGPPELFQRHFAAFADF
jgi:predicted O-methyltransferase YrrM